MQMDVAPKEFGLWLEEQSRRLQLVELPSGCFGLAPPGSQGPRHNVTPPLAPNPFRIAQQGTQGVLAPPVFVAGCEVRPRCVAVPLNALGLARPEGHQEVINAENGKSG